MRNKRQWLYRLFGLMIGMAVSFPAPASWVNDWIAQKTVSGPSATAINGQDLITFGGFNARWQRGTGPAPLMTFERPHFSVGCGGIDAKMGGFWFAGIDALVQKVQSIIQNAAAIMFKIALDSISEMLGGAAEWVENAMRAVNKIATDECSAGRALAQSITGPGPSLMTQARSLWETGALSETAQQTGASPDAAKASKDAVDTNIAPVVQDTVRPQCPTEVQQLLPTNGNASLLKQAMTTANLGAWEDVVRGMVGDVIIRKNTNNGGDTWVAHRVPSCYGNKDLSYDNLIDGDMQQRPATGTACVSDGTAGAGLLNDVQTRLTAIYTAYLNGTTPTTAQQTFLQELPEGINNRLRSAAVAKLPVGVINDIVYLTAMAYAYQSLDDLYRVTRKAALQYTEILTSEPAKMQECKIAAIESVPGQLRDWSKEMYKRVMGLRKYYALRLKEFNAGTQFNLESRDELLRVQNNSQNRAPSETKRTEY